MAKKKAKKKSSPRRKAETRRYGEAILRHRDVKTLRPFVDLAGILKFGRSRGLEQFHRILREADIESRETSVRVVVESAGR